MVPHYLQHMLTFASYSLSTLYSFAVNLSESNRSCKVRKSDVSFFCIEWEIYNFSRRGFRSLFLGLWWFLCLVSQTNQICSICEHFLCEGVSVAVPWPGMRTEQRSLEAVASLPRYCSQLQCHLEAVPRSKDLEYFSLGNWFFLNGPCRGGSVTWPEEKLPFPLWDLPAIRDENGHRYPQHQDHQQRWNKALNHIAESEPWGLSLLTAGCDGTIRTFHNYGLPVIRL